MRSGKDFILKKDYGTIYVECTHTTTSGLRTGIQRVVRNVVANSKFCANKLNFNIIPVIFLDNRFLVYDEDTSSLLADSFSFKLCITLNTIATFFRLSRKLTRLIAFFPDFSGFKSLRSCFVKMLEGLAFLPLKKHCVNIKFSNQDILLLVDSSWHLPIWTEVIKLRNSGCLVGCVVHDIIPISHPQFCQQSLIQSFTNWQLAATDNCDFYISNSRTTSACFYNYIKKQTPSKIRDNFIFDSFHLGADFSSVKSGTAIDNEKLNQLFLDENSNRIYIMVGTIEPRKNHRHIIDTFHKLWEQGSVSKLCIIGKVGWLCDETIKCIRDSKYFGSRLFMFNGVSDEELAFIYSKSEALIFASFMEGFGLPIVEALMNGLKVFASDIPIHREVGKDYCSYFSLNDSYDLLARLINYEKDGTFDGNTSLKYIPVSWQESSLELFSKALAIAKKIRD